MSNANLIAEARRNAPESVDESLIMRLAIALEAAEPRVIADQYEDGGPDELAPLSVVLSNGTPAIMQHDRTFMDHDGCSYDTWEMSYPMTVIHEPEAEATK